MNEADDDISMTRDEIIQEIECLARSPNRIRLLEAVREEEPVKKQALRNRFDMSRTTLGRNLEMLKDQGWIETPAPRTYALTCTGSLVTTTFSDLMEVVQLTKRLRPFLQWIPQAEIDIDLRLLADANVVCSTENDPYAPVHRHVEVVKQADHVRLLLSVMGQQPLEEAGRRILNGDAEYETVVAPGLEETINTNAKYAELIDEQRATGRHEISVYDGNIPYYLGILDDIVQIGAEDAQGVPRALLETDSEDVREWAERKYAEYKQEARPLHVTGRPPETTVVEHD